MKKCSECEYFMHDFGFGRDYCCKEPIEQSIKTDRPACQFFYKPITLELREEADGKR